MLDCSIIIPHKPAISNNKALELNIKMLLRHTNIQYELIIDSEHPKDPYRIWNEVVKKVRSNVVVFSNSDVIFGPGWDILVCNVNPNQIITGYLVEPGNIGVAEANIYKDFGKTPDDFDIMAFENFVRGETQHIEIGNIFKQERGWYMPCAMDREWFLDVGGFPMELGFPNPNDAIFWDKCVADYNTTLLRVPSYAYHFQNLSSR